MSAKSDKLFQKRKKESFKRNKSKTKTKTIPTILILTEGEKTEPFYLKELCKDLGFDRENSNIEFDNCGSAPITIVNNAIIKKDRYDDIYCVFDKDQHESYEDAIKKAKKYNNIHIINSVICFEVWFLLHYQIKNLTHQNADSLIKELIKIPEFKNYQKADKNTYAITKNELDNALTNASLINKQAEQNKTDNPITKIPILIEKLREKSKDL